MENIETTAIRVLLVTKTIIRRQPLEVFHKIHRKTTVLESLFYTVAGLQPCKFTEKRLHHRCFPVHIANFLKTSILKNIANDCF